MDFWTGLLVGALLGSLFTIVAVVIISHAGGNLGVEDEWH